MKTPSTLEELIDALRCLPGVGPKSAQRMAYHLLQRDKPGAKRLGTALTLALERIHHCEKCNTFTEETICTLCRSPKRDGTMLCVVETPADLLMMEQTLAFGGMYFVLLGRLSPLDGIGPKEIHLDKLIKRATDDVVQEVILATNFTRRVRLPRTTSASCCARAVSRCRALRADCRSAASWSMWIAGR